MRGFSLVEVLVSLLILAVTVTAVATGVFGVLHAEQRAEQMRAGVRMMRGIHAMDCAGSVPGQGPAEEEARGGVETGWSLDRRVPEGAPAGWYRRQVLWPAARPSLRLTWDTWVLPGEPGQEEATSF